MNTSTSDKLAEARGMIRGFEQHYGYDASYLEALMEASPGAFEAYYGAMAMARYKGVAQVEALMIAQLTTAQVEDCGPCLKLGIKMAQEAGVADTVIRGTLKGGVGLTPEQRDIHKYAHAVAANEAMEPELLPRLRERLGREAVAELALGIVATRLYPTMKRALGYAKSCSLMPELLS